ncbi:FecCD family ABC transporter permease [Phreatobacter stygius]|uniref:Iron ABC transporter permease n=1 Tax=Phreatobacter stygius TaxID=1940610 RepID=A0A4D7BB60_9HYPH|nr:iron ABC transporter permease [Phreatobacter stygius]
MSLAAEAGAVPALFARQRRRLAIATLLFIALFLALAVLSLGTGAVAIPPARVVAVIRGWFTGDTEIVGSREALVVFSIRLPRLVLGALIGAALAVSGTLMQGLFRNPLADPGLVGVSSGAALAAASTIVLGDRLLGTAQFQLPFALLPLGAFLGGLASTLILYAIATREGRTSVAIMLLAGVALGAFAGALTGLLSFISDDRQLRDLTFWSLGSLSGASWTKVMVIGPLILPVLFAVPVLARGLNALLLGEAEAFHLGIPVQRLKNAAILMVAVAVGAGVAASGVIGFVGIVVPHLLRLLFGPDHRMLLPFSALLGATLLTGADLLARVLVAPAELPIGILTAAIGAPFFLWLLLRRDRSLDA